MMTQILLVSCATSLSRLRSCRLCSLRLMTALSRGLCLRMAAYASCVLVLLNQCSRIAWEQIKHHCSWETDLSNLLQSGLPGSRHLRIQRGRFRAVASGRSPQPLVGLDCPEQHCCTACAAAWPGADEAMLTVVSWTLMHLFLPVFNKRLRSSKASSPLRFFGAAAPTLYSVNSSCSVKYAVSMYIVFVVVTCSSPWCTTAYPPISVLANRCEDVGDMGQPVSGWH